MLCQLAGDAQAHDFAQRLFQEPRHDVLAHRLRGRAKGTLGGDAQSPLIHDHERADDGFANTLLEEEHVACVPGNAFGEMSGRYVRMSYATAYEKIEQALEKMRRFVQRYG